MKQLVDRRSAGQPSLTLADRRAFLRLPVEERRRRLAEQAGALAEHYATDRDWRELEAGDLVDS
jgi:hypothetical protein